jgi:hypothetical protein
MGISRGKKIVTDGIVLYLDAANNRSYVSGSTTWNNLIDTVTTASLFGGSTFNSSNAGSIQFNGTDGYVDLSNTTTLAPPYGDEDWSFNVWFKLDGDTGTYQDILSSSSTTGDWWQLQINYTIGTIRFVADDGSDPLADLTISASLNEWNNTSVTRDKSSDEFKLYLNGSHELTSTDVDTTVDSIAELLIGAVWGASGANTTPKRFFTSGSVAVFQIYDKALSTAEISQNYNALKDRFI